MYTSRDHLTVYRKITYDSISPNRLTPTLLLYESLPYSVMPSANTVEQKARMEMMQKTRNEVAKFWAEQQVAIDIKANELPPAKFRLKPGDMFMRYSEGERSSKQELFVAKVNRKNVSVNMEIE